MFKQLKQTSRHNMLELGIVMVLMISVLYIVYLLSRRWCSLLSPVFCSKQISCVSHDMCSSRLVWHNNIATVIGPINLSI